MPLFLRKIDTAAALFFQNAARPAFLDVLMAAVTHASDAALLWIAVTAAMIILPRTRKMGVSAALALALCAVSVELILKPLVGRPRPYAELPGFVPLIAPPSTFSFPSGHAAHAAAASTAYLRHNPRRTWPFAVLSILIAFSRVYLGVHYLTDAVAGLLLGLLFGILGCLLNERLSC